MSVNERKVLFHRHLVPVTRSSRSPDSLALARPARVGIEPADVLRPEVSRLAVFAVDSGSVFTAADADAAALVLALHVEALPLGFNLGTIS